MDAGGLCASGLSLVGVYGLYMVLNDSGDRSTCYQCVREIKLEGRDLARSITLLVLLGSARKPGERVEVWERGWVVSSSVCVRVSVWVLVSVEFVCLPVCVFIVFVYDCVYL